MQTIIPVILSMFIVGFIFMLYYLKDNNEIK